MPGRREARRNGERDPRRELSRRDRAPALAGVQAILLAIAHVVDEIRRTRDQAQHDERARRRSRPRPALRSRRPPPVPRARAGSCSTAAACRHAAARWTDCAADRRARSEASGTSASAGAARSGEPPAAISSASISGWCATASRELMWTSVGRPRVAVVPRVRECTRRCGAAREVQRKDSTPISVFRSLEALAQ